MKAPHILLAGLLGLAISWVHAQPSRYDATSQVVTIPSVSVGAATFVNVTLKNAGDFVFDLQGATEQKPAGPAVASYDSSSGLLRLPAVQVGDATFLDVSLLNIGNYRFALQAASPWPASTAQAVAEFFADLDKAWASGVPASGAARYAQADSCYLSDGRSKAWLVAEFDRNLPTARQRDADQIGRRTQNIQVLGLRNVAAGSGLRQELDLQVDVLYRDGSIERELRQTLISGSNEGSPGCTVAQDGSGWRSWGNRHIVGVAVKALNVREALYDVSSGQPKDPALQYRRLLQFAVNDPLGQSTHVVVSGPGFTSKVNGQTLPFSLKLISPRLLRSAPELANKSGNYLNLADDAPFRACRLANDAYPSATVADCVGSGALQYEVGYTAAKPDFIADFTFLALGFVQGGLYRFDVFNDDGWKTPGGQSGRTPAATYYRNLRSLPYTFVEMAGTAAAGDRFSRMNFGALSLAQVAANANVATPAAMAVTWNVLPASADARVFALVQAGESNWAVSAANPASAWPSFLNFVPNYPGPSALAQPVWPVGPRQPFQSNKVLVDFGLLFSDRNDALVHSLVRLY